MLTGLDLTFSGGGAGGHKNAGRGGVWQGPGAGCGPAGRAELLNTVSSPAQLHHYTRPQQPATSTSCNAAAHWPLVPGPRAPDQSQAATQCVCGGSSFPTVRTVSGFRCTLLQLASRWLGPSKGCRQQGSPGSQPPPGAQCSDTPTPLTTSNHRQIIQQSAHTLSWPEFNTLKTSLSVFLFTQCVTLFLRRTRAYSVSIHNYIDKQIAE